MLVKERTIQPVNNGFKAPLKLVEVLKDIIAIRL